MSPRIHGTVRDKNSNKGVKGLRVEAWDDDYPDSDDLVGSAITNTRGNYSISYLKGYWDTYISRRVITWRPDIYVRVFVENAAGQWVPLARSSVHPDHDPAIDLRIDLDIEIQEEPITKMTNFKPDEHGFHFRNVFTVRASIASFRLGSWDWGFCGGMCAAALHRFKQNEDIPDDTDPPVQGTPLYDELFKRQVLSLTSPNMLLDEILAWQSAPDRAVWLGRESIGSKVKREWPKLKSNLDNDEPTILALIREEGYLANLTNNHQVLAIGYTYHPTTKDLKIHVYDPNWPDTTQTLTMNIGLPGGELHAEDSSGDMLRGFFVNPNGDTATDWEVET